MPPLNTNFFKRTTAHACNKALFSMQSAERKGGEKKERAEGSLVDLPR